MKIQILRIKNFRGIVDLSIDLKGKNAVIYGDNGVGKSGVVDAVSFLLLGSIPRLEGEGTGGLSIEKHASHVGVPIDESEVSADIISVDGKVFSVKRKVSSPSVYEISDESCRPSFDEMVRYAKSSTCFLSRRELIRFILEQPARRGAQMQAILGIDVLKDYRDVFYKVKKRAKETCDVEEGKLQQVCAKIRTTLGISAQGLEIERINKLRGLLGGEPIESLSLEGLLAGVSFTAHDDSKQIQLVQSLDSAISTVQSIFQTLPLLWGNTSIALSNIRTAETETANASAVSLIDAGIGLLDGTGKCPLCLHRWESDIALREILDKRRGESRELAEYISVFRKSVSSLTYETSAIAKSLNPIIDPLQIMDKDLSEIIESLSKHLSAISSDSWEIRNADANITSLMMIHSNNSEAMMVDRLKKHRDSIAVKISTENQKKATAWAELNAVYAMFYEKSRFQASLELSRNITAKANAILSIYESGQKAILDKVYDSISTRFIELYCLMHGEDEGSFDAKILPTKTGIDMSVDFYGRGQYPPGAYHSEGHQDSMGLAIFFALIDSISTSPFGIIVLDDVVMSIDMEHRRGICSVINHYARDHQFIITTHDPVWARILVSESVVERGNSIHFQSWDIDAGPTITVDKGFCEETRTRAEIDLNAASAYLRRELECYFEQVCGNLHASIPYRPDRSWTYGDYSAASISKMGDYLKRSAKIAGKYGDDVKKHCLESKLGCLEASNASVQQNGWVLNKLIHNNPDYRISKEDLLSATQSYEGLCAVFTCPVCSTMVIANTSGTPKTISCKCSSFVYE